MKGIQSKTMFSEVINTAANKKNPVTLNLSKIDDMFAKEVAQTPSLNRTQVEAGISAVKETTRELSVLSAGTLRAYAGIDTPIKTYSKNFPKH